MGDHKGTPGKGFNVTGSCLEASGHRSCVVRVRNDLLFQIEYHKEVKLIPVGFGSGGGCSTGNGIIMQVGGYSSSNLGFSIDVKRT